MPYLDPVVQEFVAVAERYVGPVHEMARAAAEAKAANDLLVASVGELNSKLPAVVLGLSAAADAMTSLNLRSGNAAKKITGDLIPALVALDVELDKKVAALREVAGGMALLAAATKLQTGATTAAAAKTMIWAGGLRLTGNALHWIVSAGAEILAILIPAIVGMIGMAMVWMQGAQNVQQHMSALYTTTEATANMFHTTAGQVLGMGDALQKAQNAANANVYQALGLSLMVVKEHASGVIQAGTQLGKIFDTFMAKVVQDFSKTGSLGNNLNNIMKNMVKDATGLGQVFGNLGHILIGVGGQMPGLAEVLLKILDTITRLGVWVVDTADKFRIFGISILTLIMIFEEFNRWGGLVVRLMVAMGLAAEGTLAKGMFSGARAVGILKNAILFLPMLFGKVIEGIGFFVMSLGQIGLALNVAGQEMVLFGQTLQEIELSTGAVLAIAAVAAVLGYLIYKAITATSAMQKFVGSIQSMIDKASNARVINALADGMAQLNMQLVKVKSSSADVTKAMGDFGRFGTSVDSANMKTAGSVNTLQSGLRSLAAQYITTSTHALALANTYHTSLIGAMVLADQAGVKLNHTTSHANWALAQIKIAGLVQGYRAMGAPVNAIGADMTALGIQAGITASKVDQLNQAWDQFMQQVTGGTSDLANFQTSLTNITQGVASVSQNLGQGSGGAAASARQFGQALATFGKSGAQAWQNLGQVVGQTAPQLVDWLRTAGAMGAISSQQFTQGVKDMVAQLIKYVGTNKAAVSQLSDLAHMAGGPTTDNVKTLEKWLGNTKNASASLSKIVQDATTKMGDMAAVAQQLGNVLQNSIVDTMGKQIIATSGLTGATDRYINALRHGSASAQQGGAAYNKLMGVLHALGYTSKESAQLIQLLNDKINALHSKTITITTLFNNVGGPYNSGLPYGTVGGGPGGGGAKTFGAVTPAGIAGSVTIVHQHIQGSVLTEQQATRSLQGAFNRKTFRNGSTQLYLPGRLH